MSESLIHLELMPSEARSLSRILSHVIGQAEGTSSSAYGIDTLCRNDGAARWRELRSYLEEQLAAAKQKKEKAIAK